jgi:dTDP-4-amino-4,6-dideoxygalactose transaminase
MVDGRDQAMLALNAAGIYPGVHYRDNTAYRMYADGSGRCPRAARASARLISLPMHLRLTREDVARVASTLAAAVSAPRP